MPKYNDFELDLTTTTANEENVNSMPASTTAISRHNSCATQCSSVGAFYCTGPRPTTYV